VLEGIAHKSMGYTAVQGSEIPEWPNSACLGEAQCSSLRDVKITIDGPEGARHLRLGGRLDDGTFQCYGIRKGKHEAGFYEASPPLRKGEVGPWDAVLENLLTQWVGNSPPGKGRFAVVLVVTPEMAAFVERAEKQHVSDFDLAYELSWKTLQLAIGNMQGTSLGGKRGTLQLLEQLVADLIRYNTRYLIPARPDILEEWAPRIHEVYGLLVQMSKKRDTQKWHSPKGASATRYEEVIELTVMPGNDATPSAEVVKTSDLKSVFTFDSLQDYLNGRQLVPSFDKDARVKLRGGAELLPKEFAVYASANGDEVDTDAAFVGLLETIPGIFHSMRAGSPDAWIKMEAPHPVCPLTYVLVDVLKIEAA
ncbi:hypothetical protein ACFVGN_43620, partial [Streptomyces sp. NPDC057757]|uniref:hypothetical protein n=1 Tax=Streptomyces sp. NPDC057757 TaxID=3346241 RepID=UPI00369BDACA